MLAYAALAVVAVVLGRWMVAPLLRTWDKRTLLEPPERPLDLTPTPIGRVEDLS